MSIRSIFLLHLTFSITFHVYSQHEDSVRGLNSDAENPTFLHQARISHNEWSQWISRGNVAFKTNNITISAFENEIVNLESRESAALKNRDTLTLLMLWQRDFTLDKTQNKIVQNKTGLPNYRFLLRMIERITQMDASTVFCSGYEQYQEIGEGSKVEPEKTRKFFHVWTRDGWVWKLTTKRIN